MGLVFIFFNVSVVNIVILLSIFNSYSIIVLLCLIFNSFGITVTGNDTISGQDDPSTRSINKTSDLDDTSVTLPPTSAEDKPPPLPPPDKVVLCHKPEFYSQYNCGKQNNPVTKNIADLLMLDITKMPFNPEQWLHIDIIPTKSALSSNQQLKFKHAMIQISDTRNRIIGRIGEQIPCIYTGHPQYLSGLGEISQLYRNPGIKNIKVIECPSIDDLSFNAPPTVAVLSYPKLPLDSFYVNFGFTKEESDFILDQTKPERIFITTLLIDEDNFCYLHRVGPLNSIPPPPNQGAYKVPPVEVPIKCHQVGPAFQTEDQSKSPLKMSAAISWKDVEFGNGMDMGIRPRSRIRRIFKPDWKDEVGNYNLHINGVDEEGLTAVEREIEADNELGDNTTIRRPNVPLIVVDDEEDEVYARTKTKTFDDDDEECEDNLRIQKPLNVKDEISRIYLECNFSKTCIGEPAECLWDSRDCDFVVSWGKEGNYIAFDVIANKMTYIAVGLSEDDKMGDDSVIECNREDDHVVGYTSWNYQNGNERGNIRLRSCESMKDFTAELIEDKIFCSWKRPIKTTVKGHTFDLDKPFFILTAMGHTSTRSIYGNIEKHEIERVALKKAEIFNKYLEKTPSQYAIVRFHGILMLITWMILAPLATFVPRYLKGTFVNRRICGYSIWFGLHVILVSMIVLFTLGATIILPIFVDYERPNNQKRLNLHSILGISICSMILLQVVLAELMIGYYGKWQKMLPIKYLHGMVGHVMSMIGHACILTSRDLKDGLPCSTLISYIIYLVFGFILHLMMSYQICYSDFVRGLEYSRVYKIFIVDHDEEHDQPRRPRRRKTYSLQAEAVRRRRLTLDDFEPEKLEEGAIINPEKNHFAPEDVSVFEHALETQQEEPGAGMRRAIFALFVFIIISFAFYHVVLMLLPKYYPDCPSQNMLQPGEKDAPDEILNTTDFVTYPYL